MVIKTVINFIPFNRVVFTISQEGQLGLRIPESWERNRLSYPEDVIVIKDIPQVIQPESLSIDLQ